MSDKSNFLRFMNGRSNFLGFMIGDVWEGKAASKHYRKGAAINLGLEWFLIIITGGLPVYSVIIGTTSVLWLIVSIPLVLLFAYLRLFRLLILELTTVMPYFGSNLKEWHAVEHKLGYLLANGKRKDLTLENLRTAPSRNPRCSFSNRGTNKEPSDDKLKEALEVGKQYLTPHSLFFLFFEPIIKLRVQVSRPSTEKTSRQM